MVWKCDIKTSLKNNNLLQPSPGSSLEWSADALGWEEHKREKKGEGKSGSKGEEGEPTCGVNLQTSGEATIIEIQLLDEDESPIYWGSLKM